MATWRWVMLQLILFTACSPHTHKWLRWHHLCRTCFCGLVHADRLGSTWEFCLCVVISGSELHDIPSGTQLNKNDG